MTEPKADSATPRGGVTDAEVAFGTTRFLPPRDEIPEEYCKARGVGEARKWVELFNRLFFGHPDNAKIQLVPREGVDAEEASRRVRATMASRAPKHEHKTAGCAWMLAQAFHDWTAGQEVDRG